MYAELTKGSTWHELFPVLVLLIFKNRIPKPCGFIPLVDCEATSLRLISHGSSVVVIPSYLHERAVAFSIFVLIQDGESARWSYGYAFVAASVPLDRKCGEDFVRFGRGFVEERGTVKAVHEEGGAACAVGMREEVKHLKSRGIGEVGIVCVCWQSKASIGSILHCEIGGEVVEATLRHLKNAIKLRSEDKLTIMSNSDEGDSLQKFLCFIRGYRTAVYEAESILSLFGC
jgi:hypothetical protein